MLTRSFTPRQPLDLRHTLGFLRRGSGDPTLRLTLDGAWRATRTAAGPASLHLRTVGDRLEAHAWGPGAEAVLDGVPGLVGSLDDDSGFEPHRHPVVAQLRHRFPGLRLTRTDAVLEALVPSICEQKVTGFEARRSWRQIVRRFGEPAPGPGDLWIPPDAPTLAGLPYWDLHVAGVERKRADTIRRAAAQAVRLEATPTAAALTARLVTIPGVGPWTAAEVTLVARGDADAVSVGDYHLPHQVCRALAGEPEGSDERMLELLEPFAGHRGRVVRLIESGGFGRERHGPRRSPQRISSI